MKQTGPMKAALLLSLYALTTILSGCVIVETHEGYYDHDHARYCHNHTWVSCGPGDAHCR